MPSGLVFLFTGGIHTPFSAERGGRGICLIYSMTEIIENNLFHNMLILNVPVNPLHIGILRNICDMQFLDLIFYFISICSDLCQFVGPRGLKAQNKMDFLDLFRSMCLIIDANAAS